MWRKEEQSHRSIWPAQPRIGVGDQEASVAASDPANVRIGKFDILATYAYVEALGQGLSDADARQRGMVAAIMGAQARLGVQRRHTHDDDFGALKEAAERKKKTTITAESFDHQVADKLGGFFTASFLPTMKALFEAGLSYDDVKRLVQIPSTWGAKISGEQFLERTRRKPEQ
jgi:hypothetical protein